MNNKKLWVIAQEKYQSSISQLATIHAGEAWFKEIQDEFLVAEQFKICHLKDIKQETEKKHGKKKHGKREGIENSERARDKNN